MAGVSGKKRKTKKNILLRECDGSGVKYVMNDKVKHADKVWVCRRSHNSCETTVPGSGYTYWKEHEGQISDANKALSS